MSTTRIIQGSLFGNMKSTNLFVAIAMPLRSLISPVKANFTASVRNIESGVAFRVTNT